MTEIVTKRVDVAVAVIFNSVGEVLWACRPLGKPYAGYWELPGGKVEFGETIWQALVRELREELGIEAKKGGAWFFVEHDYPHAQVRLHFYRVFAFEGTPRPLEGQQLRWAALSAETAEPIPLVPILPATEPLLPALAQPVCMAVTGYGADWDACVARLTAVLPKQKSAWYVQFREKTLEGDRLLKAFRHCEVLCQQYGHVLLVNSDGWVPLCAALGGEPEGVFLHLTERDLYVRPSFLVGVPTLGASVHGAEGLLRASQQGLRYAVLGALKETPSHPGEFGMGWEVFEGLIVAHARLPVFAIGGVGPQDMDIARGHGAHGVAMLSRLAV